MNATNRSRCEINVDAWAEVSVCVFVLLVRQNDALTGVSFDNYDYLRPTNRPRNFPLQTMPGYLQSACNNTCRNLWLSPRNLSLRDNVHECIVMIALISGFSKATTYVREFMSKIELFQKIKVPHAFVAKSFGFSVRVAHLLSATR